VREFERWAPRLRTVPFYGDKNSRDVIKQFELFHDTPKEGRRDTKFHVLITTYESVINVKDFAPVFKNQPRWEVSCLLSLTSADSGSIQVLVVDEGQRCRSSIPGSKATAQLMTQKWNIVKNDSSLLFKKLNELNSIHRIIMTGVSCFSERFFF
jgi:chromodomain-helicase-DNA-binding protein 4